jgi:hypothetical protein
MVQKIIAWRNFRESLLYIPALFGAAFCGAHGFGLFGDLSHRSKVDGARQGEAS